MAKFLKKFLNPRHRFHGIASLWEIYSIVEYILGVTDSMWRNWSVQNCRRHMLCMVEGRHTYWSTHFQHTNNMAAAKQRMKSRSCAGILESMGVRNQVGIGLYRPAKLLYIGCRNRFLVIDFMGQGRLDSILGSYSIPEIDFFPFPKNTDFWACSG